MAYRRVGPSGLQVSVIGRGTHNFGPHLEYPAAAQTYSENKELRGSDRLEGHVIP